MCWKKLNIITFLIRSKLVRTSLSIFYEFDLNKANFPFYIYIFIKLLYVQKILNKYKICELNAD